MKRDDWKDAMFSEEDLPEEETEEIAEDVSETEEQAVIAPSVDGIIADEDPFENAFQYTEPEQPKTSNWPVVVLALIMVAVLVAGVLWGTGAFDKQPPAEPPAGTSFGTADLSDMIAATCKDISLSNGAFAFYMEMEYQNSEEYAAYDKSRPLKEQDVAAFDRLVSSAKTQFEQMAALNAVANAKGITLNKAALNMIEKAVTAVDVSAFHNGVTSADVRTFYTMHYTAWLMESVLFNHTSLDDTTVESIYSEFEEEYITCDFATYLFVAGEKGTYATIEDAQAAAEQLAACDDPADFRAHVVQFLLDSGECDTEEDALKQYESTYVGKNMGYSDEYEIAKWLFADDTAVGDTKMMVEEDYVAVYMLTRTKARDASPLARLRYIYLSFDAYGDKDTVKALADTITDAFKESDGSREAFETLARQYTADFNTYDGDAWELKDSPSINEDTTAWVFDEARREGDIWVEDSNNGYHILYYVDKTELWYGQVLTKAQQDILTAAMEELPENYPVTFDDAVIQQNAF